MTEFTFTNALDVQITTSPEQIEDLLAIVLTEQEVIAVLSDDFEDVDVEHITEVLDRANTIN